MRKLKVGDGLMCKEKFGVYNFNKTYSIVRLNSIGSTPCLEILNDNDNTDVFTICPDHNGVSYETFFHRPGRNLLTERV